MTYPVSDFRHDIREANVRNRKLNVNNRSGFKGVVARGDRWRAMIRVGGKLVHLGTFDTREEAAAAFGHRCSMLR
jgi:hypothetical protein